MCRKLRRLGFDTRGTPKRLKQNRIKNSKVEFSEKAEKFVRRKGYEKLAANVGMFFSTKSCQQFSQERESNRGPWAYLYWEIVNIGTGGGGGEGGGAGIPRRVKQSSLRHR